MKKHVIRRINAKDGNYEYLQMNGRWGPLEQTHLLFIFDCLSDAKEDMDMANSYSVCREDIVEVSLTLGEVVFSKGPIK